LDANTRRERNLALRQAIEHLQAADDLIVDRIGDRRGKIALIWRPITAPAAAARQR
jgi:hypothetical protein